MAEGQHHPGNPNCPLRQSWALSALCIHTLPEVFLGSHGLSCSWNSGLLEKEAVAGLPSQNSPKTTIPWFEGVRTREGAGCTTSKSLGSHPKLSSFWPWCRCFRLQTGWQQQCSQKETDHAVQPAWASSYVCNSWYSHSHAGMWA